MRQTLNRLFLLAAGLLLSSRLSAQCGGTSGSVTTVQDLSPVSHCATLPLLMQRSPLFPGGSAVRSHLYLAGQTSPLQVCAEGNTPCWVYLDPAHTYLYEVINYTPTVGSACDIPPTGNRDEWGVSCCEILKRRTPIQPVISVSTWCAWPMRP